MVRFCFLLACSDAAYWWLALRMISAVALLSVARAGSSCSRASCCSIHMPAVPLAFSPPACVQLRPAGQEGRESRAHHRKGRRGKKEDSRSRRPTSTAELLVTHGVVCVNRTACVC